MVIELRPQPLGIFALPASYLLLPNWAGADAMQQALLQGQLPAVWPDELHFYELALAGDAAGAWQALQGDESPLAQYNRFVLQADPARYAELHEQFSKSAQTELLALLDVVAYTLGYIDRPPAQSKLDGELLALVLLVQATAQLERNDTPAAILLLEAAIATAQAPSPVFAAQLNGTLAETIYNHYGPAPEVFQHYQRATQTLKPTSLTVNYAEFMLNLGVCYQEIANGQRGSLLEAVRCYQQALRTFTREQAPELYALAHNNLALAYLALPMLEASDQLRVGIAVQSLREALKVYDRATYPTMWTSAQLNLANALQYLPSSHPQENLAEAVQIYEDLLAVRDQQTDPIGYARLLANQGNALAHLGIFDHALPKLQEARTLFISYEQLAEAEALQSLLDELAALAIEVKVMDNGAIPAPAI